MKKILAFLKLWDGRFLKLCGKVGFVLGFPLVMFLLIAILKESFLSFACACLQLIVVVVNCKEDTNASKPV